MNRGVLESSPVQHLTAAGNPNWWTNVSGGLRPMPTTAYLSSLLPKFFSSPTSSSPSLPPPNSNPNFSSWLEMSDLPLDQPWSLSQLPMGGLMMGEEEKMEMMNHHHQQHSYQVKKIQNWEEQGLRHQASMNQESNNNTGYGIMSSPNSPPNKSCVTIHNTNEDKDNIIHNGLNSSEWNSSEIIGSSFANKKPKLQVSSPQSTLNKVGGHQRASYICCVLLLISLVGVGASATVTIKSPDGDVIDCISRHDQPAFQHPLLKNHKLQEIPTGMVPTEEQYGSQVWHASGEMCPQGTVPIRRFPAGISHEKYQNVPNEASERATKGHQYAIAYVKTPPQIYGTKATINVWDSVVESPYDFSLAQIWVKSGQYETNDINTIEVGWQVYPGRYGDRQPRLFTYWTSDAYLNTGGYGVHRGGFVQISSTIAIEAAFTRTSTIGGDQFAITIQMWKDRFTGNWWLGMGVNVVPVGYWPAQIFTTLSDHAEEVQWGGEVLYWNSSSMNTINQMGSGEFPEQGFRQAGYFCNLEIAEENRTFLPVQTFQVQALHPGSYRIRKSSTEACGNHFYYGGPGPWPVHSAAVPGAVASILLCFLLFFLVV